MSIYYIGGSPCSGKTAIAELIAEEYGFRYVQLDDFLGRYVSMGAEKGYPACSVQWRGTPDEIWLSDVRQQCGQELQFYREIFPFIQAELQEMNSKEGRDILAEGAALLPELAEQAGIPRNRYVCITPTKEFQIEHYRKRDWVPIILEGCSDREQAFCNWMERDVLFAETVREQCARAEYVSILTDGSRSVRAQMEEVCRQLSIQKPMCHLPEDRSPGSEQSKKSGQPQWNRRG